MYLPISAPECMYLCIEGTAPFVGGSLVDSSEAIENASDYHRYSGTEILGLSGLLLEGSG